MPAALRPSSTPARRPADALAGGRKGVASPADHRRARDARREALRSAGHRPDALAPAHRRGPGIRAAVRDRAADRIRNGPAHRADSAGRTPAGSGGSRPDSGRRTLPQAIAKEARRRLKKRRRNLDPPVISTAKTPTAKTGAGVAVPAKRGPAAVSSAKRPGKPGAGGASSVRTPGGAPGSRPWRGRGAPTTGPTATGSKRRRKRKGGRKRPGTRTRTRRTRTRRPRQQPTAGPSGAPRSGGEWLKPPPGWVVDYTVTVERADRPSPGRTPAAVTTGQRALSAAPTPYTQRPGTTAPTPRPVPTGGLMTAPVKRTQYTDSDLTVYDVIESDADMAQEILAGADHARLAAEKCEAMSDRLEALYSKILDLKVPGLLAGMVVRLIEKAETVKNRAEAVAETLPRASEAIAAAGQKAAAEDKHVADAVKDAGHVAPAKREYHEE
ncbi:hypothetical protein [Streptomyces cylindrosporus]|uniref:Uncharacterized protein n=1 Tax=Streptomyces cylindrosporus TaxID=2927583 RepID=A0ABS9YGB7_9ACTN|nr:hypothetical protein [Streptomyces cylindrosporus]MCI3276278.1 hypothetical protein [Streptomyces cylindrosporus]